MSTPETHTCTVRPFTGKLRRAKPSGPPPNPPGAAACLLPLERLMVVSKNTLTEVENIAA